MDSRHCPICKGNETYVKYSKLYDDRYGYPGYFDLLACRLCSHLFLQNQFDAKDFTNLYSKFYPRSTFSLESFLPNRLLGGYSGWALGETSAAFAWIPPKVKILDVGCGFGQSVAYHATRGSTAVGIDADENVKKIAEKFNLDIRIGVFDRSLFRNEYFDYITLDQVLEHSKDPIQFLIDLKALLNPDGRIVISIPNAFGMGAKIFRRKWINWHTPYHLQFFSSKSLRQLIKAVGEFEIEQDRSVTHTHWIFYQWLASLTYPKMGVKSTFWTDQKFNFIQKVVRKILGIELKIGIFTIYTRVMDWLGMGDNRVITLKLTRTKN